MPCGATSVAVFLFHTHGQLNTPPSSPEQIGNVSPSCVQAFANAEEGCVITTNTTATVVPTNPPVVSTPETRPPLPPPALVDPLPCAGECAPQGRKCAGLNFPVALPCCEEGFLCVERTPAFAQCRFQGIPGLVGWTGNIIPCGTPGP